MKLTGRPIPTSLDLMATTGAGNEAQNGPVWYFDGQGFDLGLLFTAIPPLSFQLHPKYLGNSFHQTHLYYFTTACNTFPFQTHLCSSRTQTSTHPLLFLVAAKPNNPHFCFLLSTATSTKPRPAASTINCQLTPTRDHRYGHNVVSVRARAALPETSTNCCRVHRDRQHPGRVRPRQRDHCQGQQPCHQR